MPLASFPHYWAGTHSKPFHNTLSVSTEPLYYEAAHTFRSLTKTVPQQHLVH